MVNVFAGNERTEVRLSLNGYTLTPERVIQNDPFIVELIENNRHLYKPWVHTEKCLHLWEAPLPAGLLPGVYRIDAYTTFHDGHKAFGKQIFEVMGDPD